MKNHKIVCIGAGNLATQLTLALKRNKQEIIQVYSRSKESAQTLAKHSNSDFTTDIHAIKDDADIYIYALKDSVLSEIIPLINTKQGIHIHTAGSIPITVFNGYQENYGVFYPFQTFSKSRPVDFTTIPILIEANTEINTLFLEEISKNLSQQPIRCSSEQRKAVHLSGVFACNFTNHMYAIASNILAEANMPFELLLPLIDETNAKIHELAPKDAQTGPAVRYDNNIIEKHLEALKDKPKEQKIYELISKNIHEYSKRKTVNGKW